MPDAEKLKEIYLQIYSKLCGDLLLKKLVPPHEVEDIVQEAYVRICQVRDAAHIQSPKTYLVKTVRNLALDYVKRAGNKYVIPVGDTDTFSPEMPLQQEDQTYRQVVSDEEFARFCAAARHLPLQCRRVFVLKKVYGYSQREIAEELGITESAVEKQVAIAVKRCTVFMRRQAAHSGGSVTSLPASAYGGKQRG